MRNRTGQVWEFADCSVFLVIGPSVREGEGWTEHPVLLLSHEPGSYFTPAVNPGGLQSLYEADDAPFEHKRSYRRLA